MRTVRWQRYLKILQGFVTTALLVWLLRSLSWQTMRELLSSMTWSFAALSMAIVLGAHTLNIARWKFLSQEPSLSFTTFARYYGAGLFGNNFLPTGIGGDAMRIALLSADITLPRAAFSVTLDRGLGLLAVLGLAAVAVWLGVPPGSAAWSATLFTGGRIRIALVLVLAVAGAAVLCWALMPALRQRLVDLLTRATLNQAARWTYSRLGTVLTVGVLYSLVSTLLLVAAYWSVLRALAIPAPVNAAIWLVCMVSLSLLVPITINGFGLQEGVFVLILGYYGISPDAALAIALFIRLLTLIYSAVGGVFALGIRVQDRSLRRAL